MSNRANFPQDRLGNENRELDDVRARDGNFITVAAGDTGTDVIVYTFPDDVQEVHLEQIHYSDLSGSAATFELYSATLNDDGTVNTTTQQTATYNVASGDDETIDFEGEPFTEDAIVINTDSNSEVRVGVMADAKEEFEPASEQTQV